MGFGYLLIGYLITYVLYLTVSSLGLGGLALLVGYGTMFLGLRELNRYHASFVWSKWFLLPLAVCALYDSVASLNELFLWKLPLFGESVVGVFDWVTFLFMMLFNLALLYAIRMLAKDVGLLSTATAAIRNSIILGIYAVLMIVANIPAQAIINIESYLTVALVMMNVVWVACNLFLILSCNKNICRKGDEEQTPKRSRFEWVNRIGDTYEKNRQKAIDSTREQAEDVLRRRKEARGKKNKKRKK